MKQIIVILKLLRIKHYIKNLLIFIPLIFSGELFIGTKSVLAFGGFLTFCLISSTVYIINDLKDYEYDRLHPAKRNRPIASNTISRRTAFILVGILLLLFMLVSLVIYRNGYYSLFKIITIPLIYLSINIAYSFGLKNVPIFDVAIIASGFALRVLYGGLIVNVAISSWVYLTIIAGSLYLGLGKRKNELHYLGENARKVLSGYTAEFLDKNMYMCLGICLVFYSLACADLNTKVAQMNQEGLLWTVPLVLLIGLRYNLDIEGKEDGDPTSVILGDIILLGMLLVLIVGIIITIYFA